MPELAPLFQMAEQVTAAQTRKVDEAYAQVEALPHFEIVRADMADILERAVHAGKSMPVQEAYRRAVAMNPDLEPVSAIPSKDQVSQAASTLAKARNAASTVAGAPKTGAAKAPDTLRGALEAAFDG
jgi:hypothetical protein